MTSNFLVPAEAKTINFGTFGFRRRIRRVDLSDIHFDFAGIEKRISEIFDKMILNDIKMDYDNIYALKAKSDREIRYLKPLCNCSTQILIRCGCNCGGS